MPSAAAVPATTEMSVVKAATLRLASSVTRHDTSLKNVPHQRSDQASGGSRMKLWALNAAGTMARIGSTRNAATSATKALSASDHQHRSSMHPREGARPERSARRPRRRRAPPTSSNTDAAAASGQSRRSLTKPSISIDSVRLEAPPSSAGVTKKPSASRNVKVAAVATPESASGNSTRRNVVTADAPSPSLARSSAGSMRTSAA